MDKYRSAIANQLHALSSEKKIVFALLTVEKLIPNYVHFSQIHQWGDPKILEEIKSYLLDQVITRKVTHHSETIKFLTQIEATTPDTENFDSMLVSFALDACVALISVIKYTKNQDMDTIVDVAICARDTVDMYIQEKENIDLTNDLIEEIIENDPFMQREKRRQALVIKHLSTINSISMEHLDLLREISPLPIIDIELLASGRSN